MEYFSYTTNETHDDDPEKEDQPESKRPNRFFRSWLKFIGRPQQTELLTDKSAEEDDDEEISPEKGKKFRKLGKFLSRLFGAGEQQPEAVPVAAEDTVPIQAETQQGVDETLVEASQDNVPLEATVVEQTPEEAPEANTPTITPEAVQPAAPERGGNPTPEQPVTVFERRGNVLAGAGVIAAEEAIHRRHERKVKKETKQVKKAAKKIEESNKELKKQQEQLAEQIRHTNELWEKTAFRAAVETRPAPEKKPAPDINKKVIEKAPPVKFEQLVERRYEKATPEVVQKQVEVAAEKNIPLEAIYERRQEVKDRRGELDALKAVAGQLGGAVAASQQAARANQAAADNITSAKSTTASAHIKDEALYRRAIISGLIAAAVVIIAAVAYITMK